MGDISMGNIIGGLAGLAIGAGAGMYGGYIIGEHINQEYLTHAHHLVKGIVDLVPMGVGGIFGGRIGGGIGLRLGDMGRRY